MIQELNIRGPYKLALGLPEFFRAQLNLDHAKARIKFHLHKRDSAFLEILRTTVYPDSNHPYRKLLTYAGCEFEDLRQLVRRDGVENTLRQLAAHGVYLTSEEFKGKKDIVRGNVVFRVSPRDFEPKQYSAGYSIQSSGTKNRPLGSFISLKWLDVRASATAVFLSEHGLLTRSHALYDAVLPGSAVNHLLINAKLGRTSDRWFARKVPFNSRAAAFYHYITTYLIVLEAQQLRVGFPMPQFVDSANLSPIVRWAEAERRKGKACQITTIVSSAVRVAQAARNMGTGLENVTFVVSGEPVTNAKLKEIKKAGAAAVSHYAYGGGINAGFACSNPETPDEIHVNQHMVAFITHPTPYICDGIQINPFLCSTLHPDSPRLLLNVENGDYGMLSEKPCSCAFGELGLNLHLSQIRSYEKLTSEGMNYFYDGLVDFMEQVLPSEFGGAPGDYQVVEEEDYNGLTRLTLRVHPDVGSINELKLLARLQQGFAHTCKDTRFMSRLWKDAGTFRISRTIPYASPRGKILPLHICQPQNQCPD